MRRTGQQVGSNEPAYGSKGLLTKEHLIALGKKLICGPMGERRFPRPFDPLERYNPCHRGALLRVQAYRIKRRSEKENLYTSLKRLSPTVS